MAKTAKTVVVTKKSEQPVVTKKTEVVTTPDAPNKLKAPIVEDKGNQTSEPTNVKTNSTGEKVDTPESEEGKAYRTQDNKQMFIHQRDDENGQVFAGEKGANSKWYPKAVADMWVEEKTNATTDEDEKPKKAHK